MPPVKKKGTESTSARYPVVDRSLWREQGIHLSTYSEGEGKDCIVPYKRKVQALVYGPIAVHRTVSWSKDRTGKVLLVERDGYSVCAVSVGLSCVSAVTTEEDALRIGTVLRDHCRHCLRSENREEIVSALPTWVKPWLTECKEQKAYVPFEQFVTACKK
jgi:hypothetical protein